MIPSSILMLVQLSVIYILVGSAFVTPSPPSISVQPSSTLILFKVADTNDEPIKPFKLDCQGAGEPEPKYKWFKNEEIFHWQTHDDRIVQQPNKGTLLFTDPKDEDEGSYQCSVENEYGIALSNKVIVRKWRQIIPTHSETQITSQVNEGEPLTLDCNSLTGFPKRHIFWIIVSKDGSFETINNPRITTDPEGRLQFSNVTFDDANEKTYCCSAFTIVGDKISENDCKLGVKLRLLNEISSAATFTTHEPIDQFVPSTTTVALKNDSLHLHCIFGGTPLPEIQWSKKNGMLPNGRHEFLNYGKTLHVKNVEFEDKGSYECVATNGVGQSQSRTTYVQVEARPYWNIEPLNIIAPVEATVEFTCDALGLPEPGIEWFVNGIPLNEAPPNPRRSQISSTVIKLVNLDKSDIAVYQCNASNRNGYLYKNMYINVAAIPPVILTPPEDTYETVHGSSLQLTCNALGVPKPTIAWTKNGEVLSSDRFSVLENGDLKIRTVLFLDAGIYSCKATNIYGEAGSEPVTIDVKERTRITAMPEDYEGFVHRSATFRCGASVDSTLDLTVDWLRDGKLIDFDADADVLLLSDHSLVITKTDEPHRSIYTCVARTRLDSVSANATLTVQGLPNPPLLVSVLCRHFVAHIIWQPQEDNYAPILGYQIQYNTSFTPNTWELYDNLPANAIDLTIFLSPWTNSSFRITARNKYGDSLPSNSSEPCSPPSDVPHKNPDSVHGEGSTPTNMVISWKPMVPMEHNAPGFFYQLYYRLNETRINWNTSIEIYNWEQSSYTVENLETFQAYQMKVVANNERGQANVAPVEVIGFSGEDIPLEAPSNFTLDRIINSHTAEFSWEPVPLESVRGHFRGYKFETWTTYQNESREHLIPSNSTSHTLSGLNPFTINHVQLKVCNKKYEGPATPVIPVQTPEGTPGPVDDFRVFGQGSKALFLSWIKPNEPNGILTGYSMSYAKVEGTNIWPQSQLDSFGPAKTRTKISGLETNTRYRVSIVAQTSQGNGVQYFLETSTTDVEPPRKPTFTWKLLPPNGNGKTPIKIRWIPAVDQPGGNHFFVQYRKIDESNWLSTNPELEADTTILRLEPGSYDVKVVSQDGDFFTTSDTNKMEV